MSIYKTIEKLPIFCYNHFIMTALTTTPKFSLTESLKTAWQWIGDTFYGTPQRTNRTLAFAVALPLLAKALDMMVTVPYCGV